MRRNELRSDRNESDDILYEYGGDQYGLHFESLQTLRIPESHIFIDEALNAIGKILYPEKWGVSPLFLKIPFKVEIDTLYNWKYELSKNNIFLLKKFETSADDSDAHERSIVRLQHSRCTRKFLTAWEHKHFDVALIDRRRGILPKLNDGVIHQQYDTIVLHGLGYPHPNYAEEKLLPALVERARFFHWLGAEFGSREVSQMIRNSDKRRISNKLAKFVTDYIIEKQLIVTKEYLWSVFTDIYRDSHSISQKSFLEYIWQTFPRELKLRGPATADVTAAMRDEREPLVEFAEMKFSEIKNSAPRRLTHE